ncbi:MAG: Phosphatidate cytidylyltransferase [Firmicutes bacterium]|nr:Phosphatidate cytidylyltransferase [candidate division NPL-UPA2 bacterium]
MLTKVLTVLVALPIFLVVIYEGALPMTLLTMVLAIIAIAEMKNLLRSKSIATSSLVYWFPILYLGAVHVGAVWFGLQLVVALCAALLIRQLITFPSFSLAEVGANLLAALYPSLLLGNLLLLRAEAGVMWALAAVIGVWAYDSFAYFIGVQFGRLRPWRDISPKKSVEGALGGLLGSVLVFAVVHGYLRIGLIGAIVLGILVGVVGQLGDLAESALKRYVGVKDSGTLLPGHGGVLDRFDSLMFSATAVYWVWTAITL